jgi:hypothetical protein
MTVEQAISMRQRTIIIPTETGAITIDQTRAAVRAVMDARKGPPTEKQLAKARARYLGYFGSGPDKTGLNGKKTTTKKPSGKRTVSK